METRIIEDAKALAAVLQQPFGIALAEADLDALYASFLAINARDAAPARRLL